MSVTLPKMERIGSKPYLGLQDGEFSTAHFDLEVPIFHTIGIFYMQIDISVWNLEERFGLGV